MEKELLRFLCGTTLVDLGGTVVLGVGKEGREESEDGGGDLLRGN